MSALSPPQRGAKSGSNDNASSDDVSALQMSVSVSDMSRIDEVEAEASEMESKDRAEEMSFDYRPSPITIIHSASRYGYSQLVETSLADFLMQVNGELQHPLGNKAIDQIKSRLEEQHLSSVADLRSLKGSQLRKLKHVPGDFLDGLVSVLQSDEQSAIAALTPEASVGSHASPRGSAPVGVSPIMSPSHNEHLGFSPQPSPMSMSAAQDEKSIFSPPGFGAKSMFSVNEDEKDENMSLSLDVESKSSSLRPPLRSPARDKRLQISIGGSRRHSSFVSGQTAVDPSPQAELGKVVLQASLIDGPHSPFIVEELKKAIKNRLNVLQQEQQSARGPDNSAKKSASEEHLAAAGASAPNSPTQPDHSGLPPFARRPSQMLKQVVLTDYLAALEQASKPHGSDPHKARKSASDEYIRPSSASKALLEPSSASSAAAALAAPGSSPSASPLGAAEAVSVAGSSGSEDQQAVAGGSRDADADLEFKSPLRPSPTFEEHGDGCIATHRDERSSPSPLQAWGSMGDANRARLPVSDSVMELQRSHSVTEFARVPSDHKLMEEDEAAHTPAHTPAHAGLDNGPEAARPMNFMEKVMASLASKDNELGVQGDQQSQPQPEQAQPGVCVSVGVPLVRQASGGDITVDRPPSAASSVSSRSSRSRSDSDAGGNAPNAAKAVDGYAGAHILQHNVPSKAVDGYAGAHMHQHMVSLGAEGAASPSSPNHDAKLSAHMAQSQQSQNEASDFVLQVKKGGDLGGVRGEGDVLMVRHMELAEKDNSDDEDDDGDGGGVRRPSIDTLALGGKGKGKHAQLLLAAQAQSHLPPGFTARLASLNIPDAVDSDEEVDGGVEEDEAGVKDIFPRCRSCLRYVDVDEENVGDKANIAGGAGGRPDAYNPVKLVNLECGHKYCTTCIGQHFRTNLDAKRLPITCPESTCLREVPAPILQTVFNADEFNQYLEATLAAFLESDVMTFRCPNGQCGGLISVSPFDAPASLPNPIPEKDDTGKALTAEAWLHFQEFRIRCRLCDTVFCAKCKTIPYHKGFTCAKYSEYLNARECRFCGRQMAEDKKVDGGVAPAFRDVCQEADCREKIARCCDKQLPCGCYCNGVRDEKTCLPCLKCELKNGADFCAICWVEELQRDSCIQMTGSCRHVFHYNCAKRQVEAGYPNARISFQFMQCPLCKQNLEHPALESVLKPMSELRALVSKKAVDRLQYEGLHNHQNIVKPGAPFFKDPVGFALDHFSFYMCYECKRPYFGGARACDADVNAGQFDAKELICPACQPSSVDDCPKHGKEWLVYKCRFCCSVATFHCWGNTHFCSKCHNPAIWKTLAEYRTGKNVRDIEHYPQCPGIQDKIVEILQDRNLDAAARASAIQNITNPVPSQCPLGIAHPPNGIEFGLGCGLCNDQKLDNLQLQDNASSADNLAEHLSPRARGHEQQHHMAPRIRNPHNFGVLRWGFPEPELPADDDIPGVPNVPAVYGPPRAAAQPAVNPELANVGLGHGVHHDRPAPAAADANVKHQPIGVLRWGFAPASVDEAPHAGSPVQEDEDVEGNEQKKDAPVAVQPLSASKAAKYAVAPAAAGSSGVDMSRSSSALRLAAFLSKEADRNAVLELDGLDIPDVGDDVHALIEGEIVEGAEVEGAVPSVDDLPAAAAAAAVAARPAAPSSGANAAPPAAVSVVKANGAVVAADAKEQYVRHSVSGAFGCSDGVDAVALVASRSKSNLSELDGKEGDNAGGISRADSRDDVRRSGSRVGIRDEMGLDLDAMGEQLREVEAARRARQRSGAVGVLRWGFVVPKDAGAPAAAAGQAVLSIDDVEGAEVHE